MKLRFTKTKSTTRAEGDAYNIYKTNEEEVKSSEIPIEAAPTISFLESLLWRISLV